MLFETTLTCYKFAFQYNTNLLHICFFKTQYEVATSDISANSKTLYPIYIYIYGSNYMYKNRNTYFIHAGHVVMFPCQLRVVISLFLTKVFNQIRLEYIIDPPFFCVVKLHLKDKCTKQFLYPFNYKISRNTLELYP